MYDDGPYDHSIGIYTWGDTIAIGYTCNQYPNAFTHNYELGVPTASWDCLHILWPRTTKEIINSLATFLWH